jgi:hypothetical protein
MDDAFEPFDDEAPEQIEPADEAFDETAPAVRAVPAVSMTTQPPQTIPPKRSI